MKFCFVLMLLFPLSMMAQLKLTWKIYDEDAKVWYSIGEKGSIQEAYIQEGILPDPLIGTNEELFQWMEKKQWRFESELILSELDVLSQHIDLTFNNVDTYASIYINGELVQETNNYFRPYVIAAKNHLVVGKNTIVVVFTPPVLYHQKAYQALSPKYPSPNDVAEIAVASMSRKPQYQFGWDWALRINTIGLNKPVEVAFYDNNKLEYCKVETRLIEGENAYLNLSLQLRNKKSTQLTVKSNIFGNFENIQSNGGFVNIPVVLAHPKLWWPRSYGTPYLYEDEWEIYDDQLQLIEIRKVKFGVRTVEFVNQKDDIGTNFYFKINGKTIFCKGGNYIPQDIFPAKITQTAIEKVVDEAYAANFNLIRIWGGGMYAEDALMNRCDELGIMVWHDFMFACALYPGNESFLKNVSQELDFQIPRLAAHPSLIFLNGNNEVEVASKHWGFNFKYGINHKEQSRFDEEYKLLFKQLIPSKISQYTYLPYYHTSPQSHWGKDEWYKNGSQHYWGVWHGKDPIEDFGKKSGRFNAEYGFQSFPEFQTLASFSDTSDWKLNSEVMRQHQKSIVGNEMIQKQSDLLYGKTTDFKRFVYFSQLTQATAVSIAIASHRLSIPYCMGTIYWQINDCWPAVSWSSIDYLGNWKALHYQIKRDFEPIAVLKKVDKIGEEQFFFVSDIPQSQTKNLMVEVLNKNGEVISNSVTEHTLLQHEAQKITIDTVQNVAVDLKQHVLRFSWIGADGNYLSLVYADNLQNTETNAIVQLTLSAIDIERKTAIIEVETDVLLKDFWLVSNLKNVHFNDNFTTVLPGKHQFQIQFDTVPRESDFEYFYR